MKSLIHIFIWILIALITSACPEDDNGYDLDLSLFVKNELDKPVSLRFYSKTRVSENDSLLNNQDKTIIYNFESNPSLILTFDSGEIREFKNMESREGISNAPIGTYYFLIHIDTLLNYNSTTWDGGAGIKRYYLYSLEDYEQINYTFVYP